VRHCVGVEEIIARLGIEESVFAARERVRRAIVTENIRWGLKGRLGRS